MRQGTFALSQKELQRVAVISSCVKGDLACARAASLLNLTPRHVKRLKSRLRQGGEAALAHASRGRPSHRRLPQRVRDRILHLARTTYAGFNDHHLCEKLCEVEASHSAVRLSAVCCARPGSARPASVALPPIASAASHALAKARCCCSTAAFTAGWKIAARSLPCSVSSTTPPTKSLSPNSSPPKTLAAISACSTACCAASAYLSVSMAITTAFSSAMTITGRWKNNSLVAANPRSSVAPWSNSVSPTSPPTVPKPRAASNASGA